MTKSISCINKNNENFILFNVDETFFHPRAIFVCTTNILSPSEILDELKSELDKVDFLTGFTGKLYFDAITSTSNKDNRYFECEYDGVHFKNFKKVPPCDILLTAELKKYSADFLKSNVHKLNMRLLSNATKFAIKNGILL